MAIRLRTSAATTAKSQIPPYKSQKPRICVDISAECLMKARTLSKELLQEDDVICLVGDGLIP